MKLFREPLFHFLILGAVIFVAHGCDHTTQNR